MKFADHAALKKSGRNFDCSKCEKAVKKLRKCESDREDFTPKDGSLWPIRLSRGGPAFSYCPGKATWDEGAAEALRLLETTYFLRQPLFEGSFMDQPWWYAEFIYEYLPVYDDMRENNKQRAMWGSSGDSGGQNNTKGKARNLSSTARQKVPSRR